MQRQPSRRFAIGTLCCTMLLLSACARPQELASRDVVPAGPTPQILPLDELLAQADAVADAAAGDPSSELAARAAPLRVRALALQNEVPVP